MTRFRRCLAAACAALGFAGTLGAAGPGVEIASPHYGEVLFHFYQQSDLTALTHLLAARDAGRLGAHADEAELLLGGLYLSYGQHEAAGAVFERLLDDTAGPETRDRAWFYLGKVQFQRGLFDAALNALARAGDALPPSLAAERTSLRAQGLMALGRFDDAATLLEGWKGREDWQAYARYNLGVALVRLDRLDAAAPVLDRVGRLATPAPELQALRDRANLSLGYAYLQAGRADAAGDYLGRVRIDGPFSAKALLGAGWASASRADYAGALVPWLELRDRDLLDSAVQESLLAVPYAFAKLESPGQAADHYLDALDAFDAEYARLDAAVARARDGRLVELLLAEDDPAIARWYWELEAVPDAADARYLYRLVADHEFQDTLRDHRDLEGLRANLRDWRARLDAFRDVVATRREAYARRLPAIDAGRGSAGLEELQARRDAVAAVLDGAGVSRDVMSLANGPERDAYAVLEALPQSPAWHTPAAADAREKQRLLRGLLTWEADREFEFRRWELGRQLAELDAQLARAVARAARVDAARAAVPDELEQYAARIEALGPRLEALESSIDRQLARERAHLTALAVRELEAQQARLATYRVQARFALATIYDRAAARTAERGDAR